ncbi:18542_t:CDS:2, partial [Racocetra fulgida]
STGSFDLNALTYEIYNVTNKAIMITQNIGEKSNIEPKISDLGLSNAFLKADEIIFSQLEISQRNPDANYKIQLEEDKTPQRDPDAVYTSQPILLDLL